MPRKQKIDANPEMTDAATVAKAELEEIVADMSPEQLLVAKTIANWYREHYLLSGYKRLTHALWDVVD